MKLDQMTRVAILMNHRLERLSQTVREEKELPPWVVPATPAMKRQAELEREANEVAQRFVGGM